MLDLSAGSAPPPLGAAAGGRRGRELDLLAGCALLFLAAAAVTVVQCRAMAGGMPMPGGWTMSMAWMRMPGQRWPDAFASFLAMWIPMMAAMMTPALTPMLLRYRAGLRAAGVAGTGAPVAAAGAAYLAAWTLAGVAVYPLGALLAEAAMRWGGVSRAAPIGLGATLCAAGVLQRTRWKARQLRCCRAMPAGPVAADLRGAVRVGLQLGGRCMLACGGLMLAWLAAGVMDLGAMAAATAAIAAERLAPGAERVARVAGVLLVAAGVAALAWGVGPR